MPQIDARVFVQEITFMGLTSKIRVEKLDKTPAELECTIITPLLTQSKTFLLDDAIKTLETISAWLKDDAKQKSIL